MSTKNRKKIYCITTGIPPNSRSIRWPIHLAKVLDEIGWETKIIVPSKKKKEIHQRGIYYFEYIYLPLLREKINSYLGNFLFTLAVIPKLIYERDNIQLLHTNSFFPNLFCSLLSKILRIPFVEICCDVDADVYKSLGLPMPKIMGKILTLSNKVFATRGNVVICDTEAGKQWLINDLGVKKENVLVAPHGFDKNKFRPMRRSARLIKKFGLENKKVLLFHGDIGYNDGIDLLIKSLNYLEDDIREKIKVILVGGGGKYFNALKKYVEINAIRDIVFTGWVKYEEIEEYLSICDIYICPWRLTPDTEITLPSKIAEVIGMGKPVVMSKLTGMQSVFSDMEDIVFFEPENPKDLARKVTKLIRDKNLYNKIVQNTLEKCKELSWEQIISREIHFLKHKGVL
jgi:glycosyltransferase involved in cell wall biosynthesis